MKRLRIRLRWLVPLVLVLIPAFAWILLLSIAPTDWAGSGSWPG